MRAGARVASAGPDRIYELRLCPLGVINQHGLCTLYVKCNSHLIVHTPFQSPIACFKFHSDLPQTSTKAALSCSVPIDRQGWGSSDAYGQQSSLVAGTSQVPAQFEHIYCQEVIDAGFRGIKTKVQVDGQIGSIGKIAHQTRHKKTRSNLGSTVVFCDISVVVAVSGGVLPYPPAPVYPAPWFVHSPRGDRNK